MLPWGPHLLPAHATSFHPASARLYPPTHTQPFTTRPIQVTLPPARACLRAPEPTHPWPLQDRLADVLGVPANKQRISREGLGFLRDELSLAHYNVTPEVQLQLGVKERGGRKK